MMLNLIWMTQILLPLLGLLLDVMGIKVVILMRVSRQFYFLKEKTSHAKKAQKAQKAQNANKRLSLIRFLRA